MVLGMGGTNVSYANADSGGLTANSLQVCF